MFEAIIRFLEFNPQEPMLFSQMIFWVFFAFVLAGFSIVYRRTMLRTAYLFAISLLFYYKSGGICFWLLIFSTITDYLIGFQIDRASGTLSRKMWLTVSLFINLGLLAYFKYTFFIVDILNYVSDAGFSARNFWAALSNAYLGTQFSISTIILPVGISFYTFQTMSYAIDIYRGKLAPVRNIMDFGFYVSFFPQLVAGPIVRASEFIPQIHKAYRLTEREFGFALYLILSGLIKKIVISDFLAIHYIDRVFESPESFTGFENLMAVYAYAFQIYCDFSGYTDIAIGLASLLGFQLPTNFRSPYKSTDVTDFWRRWHISLSSWLRDYVYISLGGNRKGSIRTYLNLMATMLIGGLWHGAHLRFIIWGGLHGVALASHKLWVKYIGYRMPTQVWYKIVTWALCFHFVCFAWIFFRAESIAHVWIIVEKILFYFSPQVFMQFAGGYQAVFWVLLSAFVLHLLPEVWKSKLRERFIVSPIWSKVLVSVAVALFIYQFKSSAVQAFIYFQF